MKKVVIGDNVKLDVPRLLETRLLVQANSGGGKSWLLRRLLEQTHGHVQQIIIDMEGEFYTLREKHDYILASDEGDVPVSVKSAKLFAKKLLELNVSAIIDLYELKPRERLSYVRLFIDGLINAPKKLWHPVLIVIDEANHLCPQKGQAESAESIISLCQRGRKRGFCVVLATQRISMLDKNAAAECNNKLVGRTGLDVDRKRASEELGFTTKEQSLSLRLLKAGEFYAYGPAISDEVTKLKVGGVGTTHPKAGNRIATAGSTPPTTRIKKILHKLLDLPQEAAKELKTLQDRDEKIKDQDREIKRLNREKKDSEKGHEGTETISRKIYEKDKQNMEADYNRKIEKLGKAYEERLRLINTIFGHVVENYNGLNFEPLRGSISRMESELEKKDLPKVIVGIGEPPKPPRRKSNEAVYSQEIKQEFRPRQMGRTAEINNGNLVAGAERMLNNLAIHNDQTLTREQLALLSDIKLSGGTFGTYIGRLKSHGFIDGNNSGYSITKEGLEYVGEIPEAMPVEKMQEMWRSKMVAGAQRMFDNLLSSYPEGLSKQDLADMSDIRLSGGTFGTYIGRLKSAKMIESKNGLYYATETIVNGV